MTEKPSAEALDLLERQHLPVGNRLEFQDIVVVSQRLAAREIDALRERDRERLASLYQERRDYKAAAEAEADEVDRLTKRCAALVEALEDCRSVLDSATVYGELDSVGFDRALSKALFALEQHRRAGE